MSYTHWHVGMKVICVSSDWSQTSGYGDELLPVVGDVYTLRTVEPDGLDGHIVVSLLELPNEVRRYSLPDGTSVNVEPAFGAEHFRPVQPRATDISIFTAMLNPSKVEERA